MPAPGGYAFADVGNDEPARQDRVTLPPTWEEPPLPRRHQIVILVLLEAFKWTEGDAANLAALHAVFFDKRAIVEIAECSKCSNRIFYRRLGELRELITAWHGEHEEGEE
ncbi:MAG: hypothetical protein LV479_02640 [Methylacidiphilales bacterium]|nr:hypothetical protein [Candidatus Methylacidiphilales bacterium]